MGIDKATIHRIGRQTIRGENTPQGDNTLIVPRRNVHAPVQEWAYNTTGYELKAGYIVEVTDFDPEQNKYTIRRPSADGLPNIAVVKSSQTLASDGNRVELQFSGTALLWYSSTAPTVADTVGSKKDSFNLQIGVEGFAPLETGGSGRCRARFFNPRRSTFIPRSVGTWELCNIRAYRQAAEESYTIDKYPPEYPKQYLETPILGVIKKGKYIIAESSTYAMFSQAHVKWAQGTMFLDGGSITVNTNYQLCATTIDDQELKLHEWDEVVYKQAKPISYYYSGASHGDGYNAWNDSSQKEITFEVESTVQCKKLYITADISMDASIEAHDDIPSSDVNHSGVSAQFSIMREGTITLMQEEY